MGLLGPATTPGVEFQAEVALGNLNDPSQALYDSALYDTATYSTDDISWTDITERLESFSFSAGRDRWGSQFRGATGSLRLSNQDGVFNPDFGQSIGSLVLRPGRFVRISGRVTGDLDWIPLFTGRIEALSDVYTDAAFRIHSVWQITDLAAYLSMIKPPALTSPIAAGQLTSDRVIQILTLAKFQNFDAIETGVNTMLESTLSKSYYQECQVAAAAEGGAFFMAKAGNGVFLNQGSVFQPTPGVAKWSCGGLADEILVIDSDTDFSMGNVRNQVSMARIGGIAQTVNDTVSQALYQIRTHQQFDLECETDAMAFTLAERYRDYFAFDSLSMRSLRLVAESESAARDLLSTELLDTIEATIQTAEGWGYTSKVTVQGFSFSADASDWQLGLTVERADRGNPLLGGPYSDAFSDAYDPSSTP